MKTKFTGDMFNFTSMNVLWIFAIVIAGLITFFVFGLGAIIPMIMQLYWNIAYIVNHIEVIKE